MTKANDAAGAAASRLAKAEADLAKAQSGAAGSTSAAAERRLAQAANTRDLAAADAITASSVRNGVKVEEDAAARRSAAWATTGKAGGGALLGIAGAATYLGYEGTKRMSDFTDQMSRLYTLANVPKNQLQPLSDWVVNQSPALRQNVHDLGEEMYAIASSAPGIAYTTQQLEEMTKAASNLSVLGGPLSDPLQTARVFGTIRAAGGLGTPDTPAGYTKIGATASAIVGSGDMTMPDLINALGSGGLVEAAQQFKLSFSEIGAVLAQLGDVGIRGPQAGHALTHAFSLFGHAVSGPAKDTYAALGLNPLDVGTQMQTQGLLPAIDTFKQHLTQPLGQVGATMVGGLLSGGLTKGEKDMLKAGGLKAPNLSNVTPDQIQQLATKGAGTMGAVGDQIQGMLLTKMFGGAKQSIPIIAMVQDIDRIHAKERQINATSDSYGDKVHTALNTPKQVFKGWGLLIEQLQNKFGKLLIPVLMHLGNVVEGLVKWFSKHKDAAKVLGAVVGGILLVVIAAYIVSMAAAAVATIAATWPILAIIAVVALLVLAGYFLVTHWKDIWKWIKQAASDVFDWLGGAWDTVVNVLTGAWDALGKAASAVWDTIKGAFRAGYNAVAGVINDLLKAINTVTGALGLGINIPLLPIAPSGGGGAPAAPGGQGGAKPAPMMASGGIVPSMVDGGFVTTGPRAIVGEGHPAFPEFVVPTDPVHRRNATDLYSKLGAALFAGGGTLPNKPKPGGGGIGGFLSGVGSVASSVGGQSGALSAQSVEPSVALSVPWVVLSPRWPTRLFAWRWPRRWLPRRLQWERPVRASSTTWPRRSCECSPGSLLPAATEALAELAEELAPRGRGSSLAPVRLSVLRCSEVRLILRPRPTRVRSAT